MLEKQIERKLCDEVDKLKGMCLKQNGIAGIPDRLVLLPNGRCAFVELKAPGEKPRKLQVIRMKQLQKMGFRCFVIDDQTQIGKLLSKLEGGES